MERKGRRLSALAVDRATKPGMYCDGLGLYLRVGPNGAKSWVFRYRADGKLRDMGLGPTHTRSLAEARAKAEEARKLRLDGGDPLKDREAARGALALEKARGMTFAQCADAYIEAHAPGWKNAKHGDQWRNTLATYAFPVFGELPVQAVDLPLVLKAIEPIWATKTETASRLRGRIESVLDWATVRGYRQGENPARWKGHLDSLLPARAKVAKVEHHPALPYDRMGVFMADLRRRDGTAARALEFAILTATRTSETIGATWNEIDLTNAIWTIPPERIKARKEHRVPLTAPVLAILNTMAAMRQGDFVFAGGKAGKPLSNMALLALLERMGHGDITAHGFRSSFRDWASERTAFPRDVAEMALAHAIGDKVEAAYRRGDLFAKRRQLMNAWADYCGRAVVAGDNVVALRTGA
ncbi:MAG: integrase arm-type DNA-binding domain-containing protein [Alphaproteobacteria bacterium]|nr:integrase arm-type DNA-binding domain-containing protein [Alphaproteobacteria bacterium]